MKGNGIHYPFFKGALNMKKKEIETLFKKTPKKGFYTLEKDGYLFVLESLGLFKYGLLSVIEEKGPLNEFIDRLVIHNQYVERSYIINNEFGVVLNRIDINALELLLDEIKSHGLYFDSKTGRLENKKPFRRLFDSDSIIINFDKSHMIAKVLWPYIDGYGTERYEIEFADGKTSNPMC